jgi:hypothetical protein
MKLCHFTILGRLTSGLLGQGHHRSISHLVATQKFPCRSSLHSETLILYIVPTIGKNDIIVSKCT